MRIPAPNTGHPRFRLTTARRLAVSLIAMLVVLVGGTAGYMAFGFGFYDAAFETVTTVTTVGYGELHHFSHGEQVFTIILIFLGVGTAAYTLSVLIESFIEGYLGGTFRRHRMEQQIKALHEHVIVCGWGRVGRAIAHNLEATRADVVVVDSSADRIATVIGPSVHGDATDEEMLAGGRHRPGPGAHHRPQCRRRQPVRNAHRALDATRPVHRLPGRERAGGVQAPTRPAPTGWSTRRTWAAPAWPRWRCSRT